MNETPLRPCGACGEGILHPCTELESVEIDGKEGCIRLHHSVCDVCGAHLTDAHEMLLNRRAWNRFRKEVGKIPMGADIAVMRKRHGLTQSYAGRLFGGGPVAFSKYETDDVIPDEAMVGLLKLAIRYPDIVERLAQVKELSCLRTSRLLPWSDDVLLGNSSDLDFSSNETVESTLRLTCVCPISKIGERSWSKK